MKFTAITVLIWLSGLVELARADEYAARSAAAAEAQACWAALDVIVSIGSFFVSVTALIGLFKSLRQTQTTLKVTRELGQLQARAYMEASKLEYGDENGSFVVTCRNSGLTPSPFVAVGLEAVSTTVVGMGQALKLKEETPAEKSWAGIGAGDEFRAYLTPRRGSNAVQEYRRRATTADAGLLIYGTIVYRDVFDQYFKTEFAFFTHRRLEAGEFLRYQGSLPAYELISEREKNSLLSVQAG